MHLVSGERKKVIVISSTVQSPIADKLRVGFNAKGLVGGGFIVHAQRVRLRKGICHPGVRRCVAMMGWGGNRAHMSLLKFRWMNCYKIIIYKTYPDLPRPMDLVVMAYHPKLNSLQLVLDGHRVR